MLHCGLCHSVRVFHWKQNIYIKICSYECNLVRTVKKMGSLKIVPLIHRGLGSVGGGITTEKLDLPSPSVSYIDSSVWNLEEKHLKGSCGLPYHCVSHKSQWLVITISSWLCHGNVTDWKGNVRPSITGGSLIPSMLQHYIFTGIPFPSSQAIRLRLQYHENPCSAIHILLAGTIYCSLILKTTFSSLCEVH